MAELLCSAKEDIALEERVCEPENRSMLQRQFADFARDGCVFVLSHGSELIGMVVLQPGAEQGEFSLLYVVIAAAHQQKGLGPKLVRKCQASRRVQWLKAEVRNVRSQKMLSKCHFQLTGEMCLRRHYSIMRWNKTATSLPALHHPLSDT